MLPLGASSTMAVPTLALTLCEQGQIMALPDAVLRNLFQDLPCVTQVPALDAVRVCAAWGWDSLPRIVTRRSTDLLVLG